VGRPGPVGPAGSPGTLGDSGTPGTQGPTGYQGTKNLLLPFTFFIYILVHWFSHGGFISHYGFYFLSWTKGKITKTNYN